MPKKPFFHYAKAMTEQPQVPQPEGQPSQQPPVSASTPAPAGGVAGFDFAELQKDLQTKTISVNNAWILTGLGVVSFIALFLPWLTVSVVGAGSHSGNGTDKNGLLVVLAILIAVAGAGLATRKTPLWASAVAAVSGLIYLIITLTAISDYNDAKDAISGYNLLGMGAKVSIGFGFWLALLSSLGVVAWTVYTYLKDKQDFVSSGPLFPQQQSPAA